MSRKIISFILLFFFYLSFVFIIFFISGYSNILDDSLYLKSIKKTRLVKSIMNHIKVTTGVYNLYKVDPQLYSIVINYIKKSVTDVYLTKIVKNWTDFLKGKKSMVQNLDFSKMRSTVYWIISDRINKSKKIPQFLKNKAQQYLKKRFKRVPGKINIFKSLKIRKNMIQKINAAGSVFSHLFSLRLFFIMVPILMFILMILISGNNKEMFYWISFWGLVIIGTFLLTLHIFGSKSIKLTLEVIAHHKSMSVPIMNLITNFLSKIISDIKIVLMILLPIICVPLIIDFYKDKKGSSVISKQL